MNVCRFRANMADGALTVLTGTRATAWPATQVTFAKQVSSPVIWYIEEFFVNDLFRY